MSTKPSDGPIERQTVQCAPHGCGALKVGSNSFGDRPKTAEEYFDDIAKARAPDRMIPNARINR
jgi:hypothetical protein